MVPKIFNKWDHEKRILFYFPKQDKVKSNELMTMAKVKEAVDILRGAVMIVYPMGLPPHDPIRMELENNEDLSGTQVGTPPFTSSLIWN